MQYGSDIKTIKLLYKELLDKKIVRKIGISRQFPDDPKIHNYGAELNSSKKFSDGDPYKGEAYGFSSTSTKQALFKCLTESIERFFQVCYKNSQIIYSTFNSLKEPALDPYLYICKKTVRNKKIGWVKGKNLTQNTDCLIPAQLAFLNYKREGDEILLQDANTTGSAGGFDSESAVLRGIYEVVERDAIMNIFLGRLPAKKINPKSISNPIYKRLVQTIEFYNFEINLFDITTDLNIPSYLSILVDYTGLGPSLGLGTKTSFNAIEAIIGCTEESLQSRPWLRKDMLEKKGKFINPKNISTIRERGRYWSSIEKIKYFDFLDQRAVDFIESKKDLTSKTSLTQAVKNLEYNGYDIYTVNLTAPLLSFDFFVYKAIIPGLQPLPLDESKKRINIKRLQKVAKHYGKIVNKFNTLPQPIL